MCGPHFGMIGGDAVRSALRSMIVSWRPSLEHAAGDSPRIDAVFGRRGAVQTPDCRRDERSFAAFTAICANRPERRRRDAP